MASNSREYLTGETPLSRRTIVVDGEAPFLRRPSELRQRAHVGLPSKGKSGRTIHSEGRRFIANVIEFCEEEAESGELKVPLQQVVKRSAAIAGKSISTVKRIRRELNHGSPRTPGKSRPHPKKYAVDDFDKCVIRRTIHRLYTIQKQIPTLDLIRKTLALDDEKYSFGRTTLASILNEIGFKYKKSQDKRKLLVERNDIITWRTKYLRSIRNARNDKRPIVYLDETWICTNISVPKCWQSVDEPGVYVSESAGERIVIVHAGGEMGFISGAKLIYRAKSSKGDYHSEMNGEKFLKWIKEMLIPNLPEKSVVVMDNASYHSVQSDKAPNSNAKKSDILDWLSRKNVPANQELRKCELLELVKLQKSAPSYIIDGVLAQHGHHILRLPPYHCDLNPIEYVWSEVKRYVASKNMTNKIVDILQLAEEAFIRVDLVKWKNYCEHIKKLEEEYWEKDGIMEEVEALIIHTSLESTSDSSDSD